MHNFNVKSYFIDTLSSYLKEHDFCQKPTTTGASFFRSVADQEDEIHFNINEHSNGSIYISRPMSAKTFNKLEAILSKIYSDDHEEITISSSILEQKLEELSNYFPGSSERLKTVEEIDHKIVGIKKYIQKFSLPFFKEYSTYQRVLAKVKTLTDEDRLKFLPGGRGISSLKLMILSKLANDQDYEKIQKEVFVSFIKIAEKISEVRYLPEIHQKLKRELEKYS